MSYQINDQVAKSGAYTNSLAALCQAKPSEPSLYKTLESALGYMHQLEETMGFIQGRLFFTCDNPNVPVGTNPPSIDGCALQLSTGLANLVGFAKTLENRL